MLLCLQDLLGMQKDGLYLYRSVLPPRLTSLAFVGSEVATYNSMLTAGLQAEWLAAVWAGQVTLPTMSAMQKDVRKQIR
jgi:dimethylaniline monooxygenase (N-oxide forming)